MTDGAAQSPPAGGTELRPDLATVREFWDALIHAGDTHEVRIPKCRRGPARLFKTTAGYFTEREAAVRAVRSIGGLDAPAVYLTLNPVKPELRARANNRLVTGITATTTDDQVTQRRHLLVDLDPTRAAEIAATDAERADALRARDAVAQYLADRGWPDPVVVGMTGNGGELIYRIDLPNDEASATLVERCLATLASLFDGPSVTVDQTVHNAARVTKLLGSVSAKGDDVPELGRVWQLTTGTIRSDTGTVTRELLEDLTGPEPTAEDAPPEAGRRSRVRFEAASDHGTRTWTVAEVLTRAGIGWRERTRSYGTVYELDRCLTSADHGRRRAGRDGFRGAGLQVPPQLLPGQGLARGTNGTRVGRSMRRAFGRSERRCRSRAVAPAGPVRRVCGPCIPRGDPARMAGRLRTRAGRCDTDAR